MILSEYDINGFLHLSSSRMKRFFNFLIRMLSVGILKKENQL